MTVDTFLELLAGVRRCGGGWVACCPGHEDERQSLSVGRGRDGRILVHCHAGCDTGHVLAELDLGLRDLFEE